VVPLTLLSMFVAAINHHHQHLNTFHSSLLNRAYDLPLARQTAVAPQAGVHAERRHEDGPRRVHHRHAPAAPARDLSGGEAVPEVLPLSAADEAPALRAAGRRTLAEPAERAPRLPRAGLPDADPHDLGHLRAPRRLRDRGPLQRQRQPRQPDLQPAVGQPRAAHRASPPARDPLVAAAAAPRADRAPDSEASDPDQLLVASAAPWSTSSSLAPSSRRSSRS